jgi:hypothetical protein
MALLGMDLGPIMGICLFMSLSDWALDEPYQKDEPPTRVRHLVPTLPETAASHPCSAQHHHYSSATAASFITTCGEMTIE